VNEQELQDRMARLAIEQWCCKGSVSLEKRLRHLDAIERYLELAKMHGLRPEASGLHKPGTSADQKG
jgi:hypothetical protein